MKIIVLDFLSRPFGDIRSSGKLTCGIYFVWVLQKEKTGYACLLLLVTCPPFLPKTKRRVLRRGDFDRRRKPVMGFLHTSLFSDTVDFSGGRMRSKVGTHSIGGSRAITVLRLPFSLVVHFHVLTFLHVGDSLNFISICRFHWLRQSLYGQRPLSGYHCRCPGCGLG